VQLIGHQVKDLFDSMLLERSTSAQTLKTKSTIQRGTNSRIPVGYLRELAFQAVEHQRSKEQWRNKSENASPSEPLLPPWLMLCLGMTTIDMSNLMLARHESLRNPLGRTASRFQNSLHSLPCPLLNRQSMYNE
jgi:hypothetical protein